MEKSKRKYDEECLKYFKKDYAKKIDDLIEKCDDLALLDFIYKIMIKSM